MFHSDIKLKIHSGQKSHALLLSNNWLINFFYSGSCIEESGNVSGGGALELVADKGEIFIGNKLAILFSNNISNLSKAAIK